MKIIFKDHIIELTTEEFNKLFPLKPVKPITIKTKKVKPEVKKNRKSGSGKYKHKASLTKDDIALILKIHTNYPKRTYDSIAKELNKYTKSNRFSNSKVRYYCRKLEKETRDNLI